MLINTLCRSFEIRDPITFALVNIKLQPYTPESDNQIRSSNISHIISKTHLDQRNFIILERRELEDRLRDTTCLSNFKLSF